MYSQFVKYIVMPIGEALEGTTVMKDLSFLEKSQWWSQTELMAWQDEKLRLLVQHVYEHVPYYRQVFEERRLTPRDIRTVGDLQKLPLITKDDIRRNYKAFLSDDFNQRQTVFRSTGGTTGEPLQFYTDRAAWSMGNACNWRGRTYAGYKLGDKMATLAGSSLVPNTRLALNKRIFFYFQRNMMLSAVHMTGALMGRYAAILERYQPQFIRGYPSALCTFANYLREKRIDSIRPQSIFTTAETLTPVYRGTIESVFKCKVFDEYGCGDGGGNAMECAEHTGHHFSMERAILEIIRDNEPVAAGTWGEFVLTDLFNWAMPFIRYRIGDGGGWAATACVCKRGLPLLERLEGRTTDTMTFENDVTLSGPATTLIFKDTRFRQYQLVQLDVNALLVRVVPSHAATGCDTQDKDHVIKVLRSHLGSDIQIRWEFVEEIPLSPSGKLHFFIKAKS